MNWEQIGVVLLGAVMLLFFLPRIMRRAKETPKGTAEDWKAALIPIGVVVLFVIFLVMMVRN